MFQINLDKIRERLDSGYVLGGSVESYIPEVLKVDQLDVLDYLKTMVKNSSKTQPKELVEVKNEHAVISVVDAKTYETFYFTDRFYLSNFTESRNEKLQIIETFGEPHITFFGEQVKTYQGQGFVLEADSSNFVFPNKYRWASSLNLFYEEHLRGSQLVKKNRIVILYVGNNVLYGYFANLNLATNANDPYKKQFSFNFIVVKHDFLIKDELRILYDAFMQLPIGQREEFEYLKSRLVGLSSELEEINLEIESGVFATNSNAQFFALGKKNALESEIEEINNELRQMFIGSINLELEG